MMVDVRFRVEPELKSEAEAEIKHRTLLLTGDASGIECVVWGQSHVETKSKLSS
jgi:hypothetical protein